ncbi:Quinone oxidoreductase like protein [Argiope bruennichi]|uniref:Quinone oxidoreductase like protein n=1 Tax=Argiope bruennichi TaxID=94029 RepID=A0A8T0FEM0_ARGBR|nr:Quinone oxidoreductase like protein [Argiope bruennichi]
MSLSDGKMQAISVEKFGSEEVLELKLVDIPTASASTVVVKVIAAGVNPVDTYIRAGLLSYGPELPYTPGKDGAGIVHEVGEGVTKFEVGQRVFICNVSLQKYGTYAEYTVVKEDELFPLHDNLTFEQGAALGVPYFTAHRALVIKTKCSAGETVLIHGASGAVGLAAVQIAKHLGLTVIGTAGTEDGVSLVKQTGADLVVNHKEKDYFEKIQEYTENTGVNIILEMLANKNLDKDLDILAKRGRLAIIGSRGPIRIDPRKMMMPEHEIYGIGLLNSNKEEWQQSAEFILKGIEEGWVKPFIGKSYPMENASIAHKDIIHSSGAKGKIILVNQK